MFWPMTFADQLRAAVQKSEDSLASIGRQSGIPQPMLTKFMQGGDIRLATAEKLARHFGLDLTKAKRKG